MHYLMTIHVCIHSCKFTVCIFMEIHPMNIHVYIFTRKSMVYIRIHMCIFKWGFRMVYCRAYARVECSGAGVLYIILYTYMLKCSYCICACMHIHMMVRGARTYSYANGVLQGVAVTCSVLQCDAGVYVQIQVRIHGFHTVIHMWISMWEFILYICVHTHV